jgi:hypothetical protein
LTGESLTKSLEKILGSALKTAVSAANDAIDYSLYAAPYLCANQTVPPVPGPDDDDGKAPTPLWFSGIAMIVYAALAILGAFIYAQKYRGRGAAESRRKRISRKRRRKQSRNGSRDPGGALGYAFEDEEEAIKGMEKPLLDPNRGQSSLIDREDVEIEGEEEQEEEIDWGDSLMFHPSIPVLIRYGIPVTLLGTIVLFLTANLGVGASVDLSLTLNDELYHIPSLFAFTLANSVHDMWQAGVYPLSILIALCSGGWPYLKLLLMLFAWMAPLKLCPVKRRENLLMWLDALGKYR